jgi:maleate isomerase
VSAINYGTRARLGMLLPSGNQAAEPQFHAMLPAGVSLHTTRLKLTGSSEQDLLAMVERVEDAAALVADAGADLVMFHCTAVSTFSSELEESIKKRVARASGKPVTATSEALVAALRALSAKRIVMVSPYIKPINEREAAFLRAHGFEVLDLAGLDCPTADAMMAVTPERWKAFALEHRDERADAYLISCTTVRSADVIEELERELGRPVVTSNTAAVWHCLRKMGIPDRINGFGKLLSQH